ncbi:MAG: hypothetical protein HDR41_00445 [Lactobacillus sp.]|nr:hypothetical protein [Lactobacillus sp.]
MKKDNKKNKLVSITVAALFTVSPIISTTQNNFVSATTVNQTKSKDLFNHFLSKVNIFENDKKINAITSLNNTTLYHGTEIIDNSSTSNLINGQYSIRSSIMITGYTPSTHDRTFELTNQFGDVIGSASIPANSSLAQGSMDFTFNIKNGKIGKTNLGTIGKNNTKKSTSKKHHKKVTKKHNKKVTKKHKVSHKKSKRK